MCAVMWSQGERQTDTQIYPSTLMIDLCCRKNDWLCFNSGSQTWSEGQGQGKSALAGVRISPPSPLLPANCGDKGELLSHLKPHVPIHKVKSDGQMMSLATLTFCDHHI